MNRMAVMLGLTLLGSAAIAQGTKPAFTTQQATKGAAVYKAQCAMCHGAKLNNGGAPKLAGAEFLKKWSGNSVDDFHFITKSTMPQTNPGGLKDDEYLNVVAYVLQQNGFKPGTVALKAADLKKYAIKK